MRNFLSSVLKFLFAGLVLLLFLTATYYYADPFKVLKTYTDYSHPHATLNKDYISTEMFLKNYKKYRYNSFIFGSSRTLAFKPESWCKFLPANAKPFMFDASGESIYGIYIKLKYMDSIHVTADNVLILLCRDVSFVHESNHKGHLFIKHPITSQESNWAFQFEFYKIYLNPMFLGCFYSYLITGEYRPYMAGYIENRTIIIDTITSASNLIDQEEEITKMPKEYYKKRASLFYNRPQEQIDSISRISIKQLYMLTEIKRILEKNHTNYKVVLSPLYEQIRFNDKDLSTLKAMFGKNLFDFSGKNSFTNPQTNYYETSHYRPIVGDSIMHLIYK